jgi:hypothetical protein
VGQSLLLPEDGEDKVLAAVQAGFFEEGAAVGAAELAYLREGVA